MVKQWICNIHANNREIDIRNMDLSNIILRYVKHSLCNNAVMKFSPWHLHVI